MLKLVILNQGGKIMVKQFDSLKEIQKYYDKNTNTYVFVENGEYIEAVVFNFNLNVEANIEAYDIEALDINAWDIKACNINADNIKVRNIEAINIDAWNINAYNIKAGDIITGDINACNIEAGDISANDISYHAVCFAYDSIKCKSIKGRRRNSKHFVLDGELIMKEENQ